MDDGKGLQQLFQYATEYKFDDFDQLFSKLEKTLSAQAFGEAWLMRAQIKLYATDSTFMDDLEKAMDADVIQRFTCLFTVWKFDSINRFIVFPKAAGALHLFRDKLYKGREMLARWYGGQAITAVRQIQCEISYFLDELDEALALAEDQYGAENKTPTETILNQCMRFRCYLALGRSQKAEESMLDMIRLSKTYPECVATYRAFRGWANLTTNWNGDTQRFYNDMNGSKQPVLDDRLEGMRMGAARTTPLEVPFVEYARRSYKGACTVREYYVDLIHAMYWLQARDHSRTKAYFSKLYDISRFSGFVMPFVECGEQVAPLLQFARDNGPEYIPGCLDQVLYMAQQYEENLSIYQAVDA